MRWSQTQCSGSGSGFKSTVIKTPMHVAQPPRGPWMEWDIGDVCAHPGRCQHIAIRRRAKSVYGVRQSTVGPVGGSLRYASRLTGTSRIRTQWSPSKDLPKHLRLIPQKAMERPWAVVSSAECSERIKSSFGHFFEVQRLQVAECVTAFLERVLTRRNTFA